MKRKIVYTICILFILTVCLFGSKPFEIAADYLDGLSAALSNQIYQMKSQQTVEIEDPIEKPIEILSTKLQNDFDSNIFAAEEKYKGKQLQITGIVNLINRDSDGVPYISLENGKIFSNIRCYFKNSDTSTIAQISKGQELTIVGTCKNNNKTVDLNDCRVTNISDKPIEKNENKSILKQIMDQQ